MSGYNLPGNWSSYSRTCSLCHHRYHDSGTVQCVCEECVACGEAFYNEFDEEQGGRCDDCWRAHLDALADEADLDYEE